MKPISGQLMPGSIVDLDPRTAAYGGSWLPMSGQPLQAYGQEVLQAFYNRIKNLQPLTMLDIGANCGSFCLLAKFIPHMRSIAIEPVTSIHDVLKSNVALNGLGNRVDVLHPMAISDYNGCGTMTVPIDSLESGLSYLDDRSPWLPCRRENVEVMTLDALCDKLNLENVQTIKLDVEHSEDRVLLGAERTIRRCRPMILVESSLPHKTTPLLLKFGYKLTDYGTDILAE